MAPKTMADVSRLESDNCSQIGRPLRSSFTPQTRSFTEKTQLAHRLAELLLL